MCGYYLDCKENLSVSVVVLESLLKWFTLLLGILLVVVLANNEPFLLHKFVFHFHKG